MRGQGQDESVRRAAGMLEPRERPRTGSMHEGMAKPVGELADCHHREN